MPFFSVVNITEKITGICKDPDDDIFISCALSAKAQYVVTGDKALLDVKRYKKIEIVSPAEFVKFIHEI
ncbi:MAG: hypothetical protein H6Q52_2774 [Deltaproteobacteria bacterium]|nr:hypothetical protein [Deltaproteobacteria bacterium]